MKKVKIFIPYECKTNYVYELSEMLHDYVKLALDVAKISDADIKTAMDSRICDLEDTLDVVYIRQEDLILMEEAGVSDLS